MSTDYGIYCPKCGAAIMPDQIRDTYIQPILEKKQQVKNFYLAWKEIENLNVSIYAWWDSPLRAAVEDLFEFCVEHFDCGELLIVNEYGDVFQNGKKIQKVSLE